MGKRKNNRSRLQEPAEKKPEQQKPQKLKPSGQKYAAGAASHAFPRTVTAAWVYLMFTLFPLIYHDYYFDILETKVKTFSYLSVTMIVLMIGWGIFSGEFAKTFQSEEKFGFSLTDWSMLIFWAVAGISTLAAGKYMKQAFTGEEGRFVGFAFITTITLAYFLVTRYLKFSKHMVTTFLVTSWLMCLFGITDFYNMNLLHFKDNIKENQYFLFTSFIGNINSYTVFAGFSVAVSTVLFVLSRESVKRTVFYFLTMIVAMMGLTMGSSDNGYLSMAALFGFLPLVAFRTRTGLRRYFAMLAVYFTDIAWIWHVEKSRSAKHLLYIPVEGLFNVIAKLRFLPALILALWAVYFVLLIWDLKTGAAKYSVYGSRAAAGADKDSGRDALPAFLRILWLILLVAAVGMFVWIFGKANAGTKQEAIEKFGSVGNYLFFDDAWGTQRGYVWRACWEEFLELDLIHKLIGIGPDCFSVQMLLHRYLEMVEKTGQIYDSAHNEFLQYLYTTGILGLIARMGQVIGAVAASVKTGLATEKGKGAREPYYAAYIWAFCFAAVCYTTQSVVNINIPVASPLLWVFIMFTEVLAREMPKEKADTEEKKREVKNQEEKKQ